jgi:hypothetical protein
VSTTSPTTEPLRPTRSYLWLAVVAVIALQLAAWTAWFIIAAHHPVAEVPLATGAHR